jgi:hypothetical protein
MSSDLDYTIIPIKMKSEISGVPLIEIVLKGEKILLDLNTGGFAPIELPKEMIQRLNLKYTGRAKIVYDIKGNRSKCKEFIVPELCIGDFKLLNVIGYELHYSYFKERPLIGYIGSGLLRRFNLILDYSESKIVLIRKGGVPPKNYRINEWIKIPYKINRWEVELNGIKYRLRLGWDTGCEISIVKPRSEFVRKKDSRGIIRVSNLWMNNHDFGPIEFAIMDFNLPIDGVLGHNFFKSHKVYFDFEDDIIMISKD